MGFDTGLRRVDRLGSSARETEGRGMNANGLCRRSAPCPSNARTAPVAIDDVDSFGRHRRLHEHFPRIISGRTTERRRILGRERGRDGLNTQRHLNARRTESARTYSGTRIGAQPLNMKRRYLRLPQTKNPRGLRERVDVRMCPKSMWKLAIKSLASRHSFKCHLFCETTCEIY